jgi:hypothetical protein
MGRAYLAWLISKPQIYPSEFQKWCIALLMMVMRVIFSLTVVMIILMIIFGLAGSDINRIRVYLIRALSRSETHIRFAMFFLDENDGHNNSNSDGYYICSYYNYACKCEA